MKWSIEKRIAATFAIILLVALLVGLFSFVSTTNFVAASSLVAHTRSVRDELEATFQALTELENGQSRYLLTNNETYLSAFSRLQTEIDDHLAQLANLMSDNPAQVSHLMMLTPRIEQRITLITQTISTARDGDIEGARAVVAEGTGTRLMTEIRGIIGEMEAEEERLLSEQSAYVEQSGQLMLVALFMLILVIIILLAAAYVFISRELVRRQHLEAALETERSLLRTVIDALPAYIYAKDTKRRFILNNKAHLGILQAVSQADTLGKTDDDFFPPELAAVYTADEEAMFQSGKPLVNHEEASINARGEPAIHLTTKVLLRGASGEITHLVGVSQDITVRKQQEEVITRLNVSLQEQAVQLATANGELEAFSYSVSHDLRAPLRAIDGFSRILIEDFSDRLGEDGIRYLKKVRSNAQRMGELIDDLLHFSRLARQQVNKQVVEPTVIVQQVLDELREELQNRAITINVDTLPPCNADPALLRQVYANLLANAIKFTGQRPDARIDVTSRIDGDDTVYIVKDNGAGFDEKYAHKLFGVFQRLHAFEEFPGTGVGLAIVQRVIHHHGGRVWAKGEIDKGASFFFTLGEGNDNSDS